MEKLLRFKDILEMDGNPVLGERPLSFKDMTPVEYRPGEDELTNYRAYRRRRVHDVGSDTATYSESYDPNAQLPCTNPECECDPCTCESNCKCGNLKEETDVDEALTLQQRMKKSRMMKRMKSRIKIGRQRARRKMADKKKLTKRANRQARDKIVRKITKDIPKSELSFARKQEIEKRLEKPAFKARIQRLAKRMLPSIRRAEVKRKKR